MKRMVIFSKKLYPYCSWRHNFSLKLTPWISIQIYHDPPWNFPLFCINLSGNPRFSLKFWHTPLEFQLLSLYPPPLEISIDILNRGIQFFLEKPNCCFKYLREKVLLHSNAQNHHSIVLACWVVLDPTPHHVPRVMASAKDHGTVSAMDHGMECGTDHVTGYVTHNLVSCFLWNFRIIIIMMFIVDICYYRWYVYFIE